MRKGIMKILKCLKIFLSKYGNQYLKQNALSKLKQPNFKMKEKYGEIKRIEN
jgi:hypothetical protein